MAVCENRLSCIYASVWVALIWCIIIPFEIYATMNMFKYRHHPAVRVRYPMIVMGSAIFSMLHSLICEQFYYISSGFNIDIIREPPISYITSIIFPPLLLTMITITVFRIYLIHYNINYLIVQSTYDWQSLLCDKVSANDFYSRHHTTLGNCKYVSRYLFAYIPIAVVTEITITITVSQTISQSLYMFWIFILIVISVILYLKTPLFDDAYFVRKEVKYLLYFALFCIIIYILCIIYPIFNLVQTSSVTIYNFGSVIISEHIILNKINQKDSNALDNAEFKQHYLQRSFSISRLKAIHTPFSSVSMDQKSKNPLLIPSRQLFSVLIASRVCITYFVKHIQSEFCIENLLCFIELIQWIYNVTQKEFKMFDIRPLPNIDFMLSSAIPISSANKRDNENEWDWQQSILIIFKKYIHSSAQYQVNLAYEIQDTFINLIHLLSIKQQIQNGTYTFKNNPTMKKKRVHFWDQKASTDEGECSMLGAAQSSITQSIQTCKNLDLDFCTVTDKDTAKSYKSPNASNAATLFPNASAPNVSAPNDPKSFTKQVSVPNDIKLTINVKNIPNKKVMKDYQSADDATPNHSKQVELSPHVSAPHIPLTPIAEVVENDNDNLFVGDNNELVVLDIDYLYGDDYKDPEINYEEPSTMRSMRSTMRSMFDRTNKPKKVRLSIAQSFHKSWMRVNALIKQAPKTPSKSSEKSMGTTVDVPNDEYFKELKIIQDAKNLTAFEFVSITCRVLHSILQLNYQSVTRFKKSKEYIKMIEAVNLDTLLSKYGDKGV